MNLFKNWLGDLASWKSTLKFFNDDILKRNTNGPIKMKGSGMTMLSDESESVSRVLCCSPGSFPTTEGNDGILWPLTVTLVYP